MKRIFTTLLLVAMAVTTLFVSCKSEPAVTEGTASVRFVSGTTTRALNKENPSFDASQMVWKYEATKVDTVGLKTGETSGKTFIGDDGNISNSVGPFSFGEWEFKLYAYNSMEDAIADKVAYMGVTNTIIEEYSNSVSVTVKAQITGNEGVIEFPARGEISLKDQNGNAIKEFKETITIVNNSTSERKTLTDSKERSVTVPSGTYEVTICYSNPNNDQMKYGENSIVVTVFDYLTTKIGGSLDENTGNTTFDPTDGTASADVDITDPNSNIIISVNSSPVAPESETETTTVDIPAGVVKGETATLSVKPYTADNVKDYITIDEFETVICGLDISLGVDGTDQKEFSEPVTVTTYIPKGLSFIGVFYYGDGELDEPTDVQYDDAIGKLTFKTNHFSEFYVMTDDIVRIGDTYYEFLDEAVSAAKDGDTITFLASYDAESDPKSDAGADLIVNKNLKFDLNKNELIFNNGLSILIRGENNATVTFTNGKIAAYSIPDVNFAFIKVSKGNTLVLDSVNATSVGSVLYPEGENAKVQVNNSNIEAEGYCISTNAGKESNYNVIIEVNNSTIRALDGDNTAGTAILVNVPCTLIITDSEVYGILHGVVVRGGTAKIVRSTIIQTQDDPSLLNYFDNRDWGSGNTLNLAAITFGNKSKSPYQYPTTVEIENSIIKSVKSTGEESGYPAIYGYGNSGEGLGASLTYKNCEIVGDCLCGNEHATITEIK